MKKISFFRIAISGFLGMIFVIIGPCIYCRFLNNYRLYQFNKEFKRVGHPVESKLLSRRSAVGLLVGNSNHCDYFVGEIRSSNLSEEAIEKYYADSVVKSPINESLVGVDIHFVRTGTFSGQGMLPYEYENLSQWDLESNIQNQTETVYLLSTFFNWFANADMRCH